MSLGKSVQAILAAAQAGCRRILVICPAIARQNWANEWRMWAPQYNAFVLTKLKAILPEGLDAYVLIVSYEFCISNRSRLCDPAYQWDCVIVDEAQQLGNPWAQRTAAILGGNSICANTDRLWHLTGTPLSTHADQLWAMAFEAHVTDMSHTRFCQEYCTGYWDGREFQVVGSKNEEQLHRLLVDSGWMLRRLLQDVDLQLPPIRYNELVIDGCQLTMEQVAEEWPDYADQKVRLQQRLHYEEELVKHALGDASLLDADKLKVLEGLAGSVSTLRRYTGLQKAPAIADLVAQELRADEYRHVIIFFEHRSLGEALAHRLRSFGVHLLYGGMGATAKDKAIADFQGGKGARVLLVQYQTGATAINLQIAHQVILAEIPWIGSHISQAVKRSHRIGQTHSVNVRFAMLADSYDKVVMNMLRRRAREINHILDGVPRELMENEGMTLKEMMLG